MAKKGSKNSKSNRGPAPNPKFFAGKKVLPVTYLGSGKSHGNYIAAKFEDGTLVLDAQGKPVHYSALPASKS